MNDLTCPECGARMVLRNSRFGLFFGCTKYPECRATHGAHQDLGVPLGVPADKETKQWRVKAHEAFDTLWKNGRMSRTKAYEWMRGAMGLSEEEAHIGMFDKETCVRLMVTLYNEFGRLEGE